MVVITAQRWDTLCWDPFSPIGSAQSRSRAVPTEGDVVPPSWRKPGSTQCFWLPLPAFWALLHPPAQMGRHFWHLHSSDRHRERLALLPGHKQLLTCGNQTL